MYEEEQRVETAWEVERNRLSEAITVFLETGYSEKTDRHRATLRRALEAWEQQRFLNAMAQDGDGLGEED